MKVTISVCEAAGHTLTTLRGPHARETLKSQRVISVPDGCELADFPAADTKVLRIPTSLHEVVAASLADLGLTRHRDYGIDQSLQTGDVIALADAGLHGFKVEG